MDVWMEKKNLLPPPEDDAEKNFLLDLGLQLEPVIARLYERQTGRQLTLGEPVVHPAHPELRGTPDRLVEGELRGVELKTENEFSDQYGEPGTDEIPPHYLVQCAQYMMLTGYSFWDLAVLHGGSRFAIYTIKRDAELEAMMVDKLTEWWRKHIVGDQPPPLDSSDAWKIYLKKRFPKNIRPIEEAAPHSEWIVDSYNEIRKAEKTILEYRQEYESRLKGIIGDRDGITSRYGRVTWKLTKDSVHVDWQRAFAVLASLHQGDPKTPDEIIQMHTETRPGVRRFLFAPAKEGTYASRVKDARIVEFSNAFGTLQRRNSQSAPKALASGTDDPDSPHGVPANAKTKRV
jgi:predicted phage-related endonuclease